MDCPGDRLLAPERLYARKEVIALPSPVPRRAGVYVWYFNELPPGIDASACNAIDGMKLLYVGISPKAPSKAGIASRQTLRQRLRSHVAGNAYGSTLRLTLGCLLREDLGIELRRVGSGSRYTFTNPGEQLLDAWLDKHAFTAWTESDEPWIVEDRLLQSGAHFPLNLAGYARGEQKMIVSDARREARRRADALPVVADSGGPRRSALSDAVQDV